MPDCYLRAHSGHTLPRAGARPEFGPFVFHELKRIKKTFTFWLMVHSSPAESCVFVCQASFFLHYFEFSRH